MTKVLNKFDGLNDNISPTGVKYEIVPVEYNNAMYRIRCNSGLPTYLAGAYTSMHRAQTDLTKYLLVRWNESDAIAAKTKSSKVA